MSYYEHHVFFCCNQRQGGETCCANSNAESLRAYAKERIKFIGRNGTGRVRINTSGCLDRCGEGPALVVYPQAVWYTFVDQSDIDEIIDEHLVNGRVVKRLCLDPVDAQQGAAA